MLHLVKVKIKLSLNISSKKGRKKKIVGIGIVGWMTWCLLYFMALSSGMAEGMKENLHFNTADWQDWWTGSCLAVWQFHRQVVSCFKSCHQAEDAHDWPFLRLYLSSTPALYSILCVLYGQYHPSPVSPPNRIDDIPSLYQIMSQNERRGHLFNMTLH